MSDLAGRLLLTPGAPVPHNLRSTRKAWAERVAPGRAAIELPGLLAGLFSLCGHAHRIASQLAIRVVEPGLFPQVEPLSAVLQRETTTEHLRRIGLDWPRLLAAPDQLPAVAAHAAEALRACPLIARTAGPEAWPATLAWLQSTLLHMPPATWLGAWQAGGTDWLDDWSRRHTGWLPELLRAACAIDIALPDTPVLRAHAQPASLRALGAALALRDGFALAPRWHGQVAGTGPWARLNAPEDPPATSCAALLGSRLAELVRLCLPDAPGEAGAGWLAWGALDSGPRQGLAWGALDSGPRQGLAWVEMARGLLIHQVALGEPVSGGVPTVMACQVLAPTEWNLHPDGLAARVLATLTADAPDLRARVQLLMAAVDPCVPFDLHKAAGATPEQEMNHA